MKFVWSKIIFEDFSDSLSIEEKMRIQREHRESQFEQLMDAVYKRRGWANDGVPTVEHLASIGMVLPELIAVLEGHEPKEK